MREMPLLRLMSLLGQEEHNMSHNLCRCEVFQCDAMRCDVSRHWYSESGVVSK